MTFDDALARWRDAQRDSVSARFDYEFAYAKALIQAKGGSAEVRKAEATAAALEQWKVAELKQLEAAAAEHLVLYLRAQPVFSELLEVPGNQQR